MDSINYLLSIETRGIKFGLTRTRAMMKACGNPHLKLPAIQIVGTNGKGSVCAILASILKAAGYKTGLFTSPHLVHVNERIRIDGEPIKNESITNFIKLYKQDIEKIEATFFETTTAMACWYFVKENVDIAIMETGLGGRLDSTSICKTIATVITPISLDHMEILGESIREIAIEKAGAMKKDVPCISSRQKREAEEVLQLKATQKGTPLYFLTGEKKGKIEVNIPGEKQRENTALTLLVLEHLKRFTISDSAIRNGLNTVQWHGRNQILQKKPLVIFDVAHNAEGLKSFIDYYKTLNISGESTLILALYIRKRIKDIVPQLENIFEHIICTEAGTRNPMPVDILRGNFSSGKSIEIEKDSKTAIRKGLKRLSEDSGMAILGTHCLGPAVNEQFKISFDSL